MARSIFRRYRTELVVLVVCMIIGVFPITKAILREHFFPTKPTVPYMTQMLSNNEFPLFISTKINRGDSLWSMCSKTYAQYGLSEYWTLKDYIHDVAQVNGIGIDTKLRENCYLILIGRETITPEKAAEYREILVGGK